MDASDQSLLSQFLGGEERAFRELSERHMNLVYGVAMRNTADPSVAEEVAQDVFVLLAKKARKLASHPCLAGWLHKTSRNVARTARRKRIGHQRKLQHFASSTPVEDPHSSDTHLDEIDTAVEALPAIEREAIILRFFEDRDYREIAEQLSVSEPAARKRVSRAIQRLHTGLQSRLAAGTALAIIAPAHLGEAVANSVSQVTPLAGAASTTATTLAMTKTTATISTAFASLLIATLGFIAFDQASKRKALAAELAVLQEQLSETLGHVRGEKLTATGSPAGTLDPSAQRKRIRTLEEELSAEKTLRESAEREFAELSEATDGLEDEVVLAYGKLEEVGTTFGSIFKEALALSELEKAGTLDDEENKKRIINFSIKAASIGGLSKQIIGFDDNPEEGSRFFSASYKSVLDLDDSTTKALENVFKNQLATASERKLTLVNNPAFKMLEGDSSIDEAVIEEWLGRRQEFYGEIRQHLREVIPAKKQADFDRYVEEDGIGFMNVTLKGNSLGFSLGGKQPTPDSEDKED